MRGYDAWRFFFSAAHQNFNVWRQKMAPDAEDPHPALRAGLSHRGEAIACGQPGAFYRIALEQVLSQLESGKTTAKAATPWQWWIDQRSLIIRLPEIYQMLSWAPFNGGQRRADAIVNHQILPDDRAASDYPRPYLKALVRRLGLAPHAAVAMMTGVNIRKATYATARRGDLMVGAWCTAGCSNALRIGDPATAGKAQPGTINIALVLNQPLSRCAMAEALAMVTEARVAAVHEAGVSSARTRRPATGTGTDCIVIASPLRGRAHDYCGKHTLIGELIGLAAMRSCSRALRRPVS